METKIKTCIVCNKPLNKFDQKTFCSYSCSGVYKTGKPNLSRRNRVTVECSFCDKLFEKTKSAFERSNSHFCSPGCRKNGSYKKTKTCPDCNIEKPREDFGELRGTGTYKNTVRYRCRPCASLALRGWKDDFKEASGASYDAYSINKSIDNYIKMAIKRAKSASKRPKLVDKPFDIDFDYIQDLLQKQSFKCAISDITLEYKHGVGKNYYNMSIDRVDSNQGYVKGNIQLVCYVVNVMKTDLEPNKFIEICKQIVNNSENK